MRLKRSNMLSLIVVIVCMAATSRAMTAETEAAASTTTTSAESEATTTTTEVPESTTTNSSEPAVSTSSPEVSSCYSCNDNETVCIGNTEKCNFFGEHSGCYIRISGELSSRNIEQGCLGSNMSRDECTNSSKGSLDECLVSSNSTDCLYCCYASDCNTLMRAVASNTTTPTVDNTTSAAATTTTSAEPAASTSAPEVSSCYSCNDNETVCIGNTDKCTFFGEHSGCYIRISGELSSRNIEQGCLGSDMSRDECTNSSKSSLEECLVSSNSTDCLYCCYATDCNTWMRAAAPNTTTSTADSTTTTSAATTTTTSAEPEATTTVAPAPASTTTTNVEPEATTATKEAPVSTTTAGTEPEATTVAPAPASTTTTSSEPAASTSSPAVSSCYSCDGNETFCTNAADKCSATGGELLGCFVRISDAHPSRNVEQGCVDGSIVSLDECTNSSKSSLDECLASPNSTDCLYCCYATDCNTLTRAAASNTTTPTADSTTTTSAATTTTTSAQPEATTTTAEAPTSTATPSADITTTAAATTTEPSVVEDTTAMEEESTDGEEESTTTAVATTTASTTVVTTPARTEIIACYFCNKNETTITCEEFLPVGWNCSDVNEVCFTTVSNGSGTELSMQKGCMPKDNCTAMQDADPACRNGIVSSECTVCCESDLCNYKDFPPTPSTVAPPTTPWPADSCDMFGYTACLLEFQELILEASTNPDVLFNYFCSSVPSVFRCLAASMENCTCSDSMLRMNATLEAVLANMTAQCPKSCDPPAGYQCTKTYYGHVAAGFIDGSGCAWMGSIHEEQERCRARTVGSCDITVRQPINVTSSTIYREWTRVCYPPPPTAAPPNGTESPQCRVASATWCIMEFGYQIVDYLNFGGDLKKLCSQRIDSELCYQPFVAECSDFVRIGVDSSWQVTRGLIDDRCGEDEKLKCDTAHARSCILDLWRLVDEAKDYQAACNLMEATIQCVVYQTAGCTPDVQKSLNRSLQVVIDSIGNSCDNFVTISATNTTLEVWEGGRQAQIYYRFEVDPSTLCATDEPNCRIFVDVDIELGTDSKYPRCRKGGKVIAQAVVFSAGQIPGQTLCSREVMSNNWNRTETVMIAAKLDFKKDGTQIRNLTVWLRKTDAAAETTLERRSVGMFKLRIYDNDHSAVCRSINDPHLTTFDGRYYNMFQEGYFIMYRHKVLPYEVQIISQRCNGKATCNCGAGVRSGDTVFFIDRCRKKSFKNKYCHDNRYKCKNLMKVAVYANDQFTPGTRMFARNNGKNFYIWFPHGGVVQISVSGDYVNVWVTASPADWENTEGLCGFYNRNSTDDLRKRNGEIHDGSDSGRGKQPKKFSNDWRVKGDEKMYGGVEKSPFVPPTYCECRLNESTGVFTSTCGYDVILETCDFDSSGLEITINSTYNDGPSSPSKPPKKKDKLLHDRRRRDATTDAQLADMDIEETFDPPEMDYTAADRTAAELVCDKFFKASAVAQACINDAGVSVDTNLDNCIEDLLLTNDTAWMSAALEGLKQQCIQELSQNPAIDSGVADNIDKLSCPNDCSGHGTCTDGSCNCDTDFTGADCGYSMSAALEYVETYNGLCDVRSVNCSRAQLLAVGVVPEHTKCKAQPVTINSSGVFTTGAEVSLTPVYVSETEVHCVMSTPSSAYVTLSNGATASDRQLFTVYDAVCYKCSNSTDGFACTELEESCIIDNECYGPNEESPDDPCLVCTPSKSRTNFSTADSCVEDASASASGNNVGLIVGLVIGLTAFVVLVVVVTVFLCLRCRSGNAELRHGGYSANEPPPAYDNPAHDPNDIPIYGKLSYTSKRESGDENLYTFLSSAGSADVSEGGGASRASASLSDETNGL